MKRALLIDGLSMLYDRLGQPSWFYPAVIFMLLVVAPFLMSAIEFGALQLTTMYCLRATSHTTPLERS